MCGCGAQCSSTASFLGMASRTNGSAPPKGGMRLQDPVDRESGPKMAIWIFQGPGGPDRYSAGSMTPYRMIHSRPLSLRSSLTLEAVGAADHCSSMYTGTGTIHHRCHRNCVTCDRCGGQPIGMRWERTEVPRSVNDDFQRTCLHRLGQTLFPVPVG